MGWLHNGKELEQVPEGMIGFIYQITNNTNGRKYIGRKGFYAVKIRQVKGKKKRTKVESDWRDYWSSSDELKADVATLGESNFTREIIHLCSTKGLLNYLEAYEIFTRKCLESDQWYNGWVSAKIHKSHLSELRKVDKT